MSESRNRTHIISVRYTDTELKRIATAAAEAGLTPRQWCRQAVLAELAAGSHRLSKKERLLYEEFCRLRYLVGNGFKLMADGNFTAAEWEKKRLTAEREAAQIADALIAEHHAHHRL